MFLAITESKKIITGEGDDAQISFEKHKIFLYKEDFDKFMAAMNKAIHFVEGQEEESGEIQSIENESKDDDKIIHLDIEF